MGKAVAILMGDVRPPKSGGKKRFMVTFEEGDVFVIGGQRYVVAKRIGSHSFLVAPKVRRPEREAGHAGA